MRFLDVLPLTLLLVSVELSRLASAQPGQCGCYGCDPQRSFQVTPWNNSHGSRTREQQQHSHSRSSGSGADTSTRDADVGLLWVATANSSSRLAAGCTVRCVDSGDGKVLCGYAGCNSETSRGAHPLMSKAGGPLSSLAPALVAYSAATGAQVYSSSELPSADTTPVVMTDTSVLVVTCSGHAEAMAAVSVSDGAFVGDPITAPLAGASPPAVTSNGVVMWLMRRGELAGYLTNGVPHASMDVPRPVSVAGEIGITVSHTHTHSLSLPHSFSFFFWMPLQQLRTYTRVWTLLLARTPNHLDLRSSPAEPHCTATATHCTATATACTNTTPCSHPAIGGSDLSSVFFASVPALNGTTCVVTRVDVARTMNNRFVTVWSMPSQCPAVPQRVSKGPINGSLVWAPLAVATDLV
jgi:hypothetical protein